MEREEEREWGKWEGVGRRGGNGNFYNLINFGKKNISAIGYLFSQGLLDSSCVLLNILGTAMYREAA